MKYFQDKSFLFILLILIIIFFRIPSFQANFFDNDEAIYGAVAVSLMHDGILYKDAVDPKPPLIYFIYAICFKLFGVGNMFSIHFITLIVVVLTSFVIFKIIYLLVKNIKYSFLGAFLWACLNTAYVPKALATNTEIFLSLFICLSVYFFLLSSRRKQGKNLFLSGFSSGIGFFFNFKGGIILVVLITYILLHYITNFRHFRYSSLRMVKNILTLSIGFLSIFVIFLSLFCFQKNISEFIEWGWKFNFIYSTENINFNILINQIRKYAVQFIFIWALLFIISYNYFKLQLKEFFILRFNESTLILLWLAGSFIVVCAGFRFFPHYFIQFLPALCVMTALGAEYKHIFNRGRKIIFFLILWNLVVSGVFFVLEYRGGIFLRKAHGEFYQIEANRLANFVRKHTLKNDTIFIWGRLPEVYVLSNRAPGSRFVSSHLLVGANTFSWQFPENNFPEKNTLPGSWEIFFNDLQEKRPKLFIDTSSANIRGYSRYPINKYPRVMKHIDNNYKFFSSIQGCNIYRLKSKIHGAF